MTDSTLGCCGAIAVIAARSRLSSRWHGAMLWLANDMDMGGMMTGFT
jgi:hypothetical protein